MHRMPSRSLRNLIFAVLFIILAVGLSPNGAASAAVAADFDALPLGTVDGATIPGITSISSLGSSTVVGNTPISAPFSGQALFNTGGGLLEIAFDKPQSTYSLDYEVNDATPGNYNYAITAFRAGAIVFSDNITATVSAANTPTFGSQPPAANLSFDKIIISSTSAEWGLDNLTTTDAPAGISIVESGGSTEVGEVGSAVPGTDDYQIALDTPATTSSVVIDLVATGPCTVGPTTVTFAVGDITPQLVTVGVINDLIDNSPDSCTITQTVSPASDPAYSGLTIPDLIVTVADDDTAGVNIVESGGITNVTEAGATDTYTVVLSTEPTDTVSIDLTVFGDCLVNGGATATLTFNPTSTGAPLWNAPQTITVSAPDNNIADGPHDCTITHTASNGGGDASYIPTLPIANVVAHITDVDTAGVTITPLTLPDLFEQGQTTADYTVSLDTMPQQNVSVAITADSQCLVNGGATAALTFLANSSGGQTVTVTAIDDAAVEALIHNCLIDNTFTSADANYNGISIQVTAPIHDNDIPDLNFAPTTPPTVDVFEGGANDTYNLSLATNPLADVTITLTPGPECSIVSPAGPVTILAAAPAPVLITVQAVDDAVVEPSLVYTCIIHHAVTASGADYTGITKDLPVNVTDNDVPGVSVIPQTLNLTEGAPGQPYNVVLTTAPTNPVTITVNGDAQCTVNGGATATLTFNPSGAGIWNVAQAVTVAAIDDAIAELPPQNCTITQVAASADTNYNGIAVANVVGTITDNDVAGATVAPLTLNLTEGAPGQNYTVVLNTQPASPVTITVSGDAQCTVNGSATATLTFNPSGAGIWNVAQPITVAAIDDLIVETPPQNCTITHVSASPDAAYNAIAIANVVGTITDNDTAAVTVAPLTLNLTEGAPGQNYTVVLTSQPTNPVTISVSGDAQCTVNGGATATLTFNPSGAGIWNVAQPITVAAIDDLIAETPPQNCTITQVAASSDATYNGIAVASVVGTITDNDVLGVNVSPLTVNITEGQPGQNYNVVLTTQPTNPVTITVNGDAQCTVNGGATATLTFNPSGAGIWNVAQPITVAAIDDIISETPPQNCTITHTAASADTNYNGIGIANVVGTITDNDTPGVTVVPLTLNLTEGAPGQNYTVVLDSQPTNPVTVTITGDAQCSVAPLTLTFNPSGAGIWNVAQSVTVTAIDDAVIETPPQTCTITQAATSADTNYNLAVTPVVGTITDNDFNPPGVTVTPLTLTLAEGAPGQNYTVVLDSQPTNPVTVTITGDAQCSVAPLTLTFNPSGAGIWNVAQSVTVTAIDDAIAEPPGTCTITQAATSADTNYNGIAVANVVGNITDNDILGVTVAPQTLSLTEGLPGQGYTIVLTSQPTNPVTITVSGDPQCTVNGVATTTLTFNPSGGGIWNAPQTVTVAAIDDLVVEPPPQTCTVTHVAASIDTNYNAIAIPPVAGTIADNDAAGVTVTPLALNLTEGQPGQNFTVVLTTPPTGPVTITVSGDAQCTVNGGATTTLTFNPSGAGIWNVAQPVTVTAIDDIVVEAPPQTCTITQVASSSDPGYNAIVISNVVGTIADNDGITGPIYSSLPLIPLPSPSGVLTITPPGVGQAGSGKVTIKNVGIGTLNIFTVAITGTIQIQALLPANQHLAANQSSDVFVQCDANFVGSGTLTITHDGTGTPTSPATYTVTCTAGGVAGPGYSSFPSPGTILNVGTVLIGSPIATSLTVTEVGNATLSVAPSPSGMITGPNASEFRWDPLESTCRHASLSIL